MDFYNKTVIITGAGQGIGLAIAEAFINNGATVTLAEKNLKNGQHAEQLLKAKGKVKFIHTDVSDEESVRSLVEQTANQFGTIDILINNAATACNKPLNDLTKSQWQNVINVNLTGPFLCSKYCSPYLAASRGAIVNIASSRALMSEPDTEAYTASKSGLVGLTHALAVSLGPTIRVNCISPGWIITHEYQFPQKDKPEGISCEDHSQHPAGRVGYPADIAEMTLYLCSEKSGFITGQNFVIDGGITKKMIYI